MVKVEKHGFAIFGNGFSGTSLLQSILNAHTGVVCDFEKYYQSHGEFDNWVKSIEEYAKKGLLYGNKLPIEKMCGFNLCNYVSLAAQHIKIIWIVRKYGGYRQSYLNRFGGQPTEEINYNWQTSNNLFWMLKEKHPADVVMVNFEDLVIAPEREVRRLCDFLKIGYEPAMLDGCKNMDDTVKQYHQNKIDIEKAFV
jgi:hypothetical protein